MTNRSLNEGDLRIAQLRQEIQETFGTTEWLNWPNASLAGDTPEQRLLAGDYEAVRRLIDHIRYIGIT